MKYMFLLVLVPMVYYFDKCSSSASFQSTDSFEKELVENSDDIKASTYIANDNN